MPDERILIVEGDIELLNTVSLALRRCGYQVEPAEDGYTALDILGAQPPFAVLIAALDLPGGVSGIELLRLVHKMDDCMKVVLTAPVGDLETATSAMRNDGAYDFVQKPFSAIDQLVLAVERAAAQRRLTLERDNLLSRLQRESRLLRIISTSTGDAVLSANAAGVLQIANPAAARLLGTDNAEGSLAQSSLPPALLALIANWQAVGEGQPAIIEMAWPNGSVQMVSLHSIQELNGSPQGWVAVLRDITHVKHLEELKTRVLSETAGKICPPLAQAMNTLIELNILTSRNERINTLVYRLTQTWKRIQEWGEDLNTLIRIDSQTSIYRTNVDLQPVFQELVHSQCEPAARLSGLDFNVQIDPNLPEIFADPDLLRRLLYGLVNRAVGRSMRGSAIQLHARSYNSQVWISISDEGPAVNESDLPNLFERKFVQTQASGNATGLEMALVKSITDRMDGQVWVGGQERKGSTIFVCLPAQLQRSLC